MISGVFASLKGSQGPEMNGKKIIPALFVIALSISRSAYADPTLTTLVTLNGTNGEAVYGSLTTDALGNFYGTTNQGGTANDGTIFRYSASTQTLTTLASLNGSNGKYPFATLIFDSAGNLYGTATGRWWDQ